MSTASDNVDIQSHVNPALYSAPLSESQRDAAYMAADLKNRNDSAFAHLFNASEVARKRAKWGGLIEKQKFGRDELNMKETGDEVQEHRRRVYEDLLDRTLAHAYDVHRDPALLARGEWLPGYQAGQRPSAFGMTEQTLAANIDAFPKFSLGIFTRFWPRVIYQDLVGVVSGGCCTGYWFMKDFLFGSAGCEYAVGHRIDNVEDPDCTECPPECTDVAQITMDLVRHEYDCECQALAFQASQQAIWAYECYHGGDLMGDGLAEMAKLLARNKNRLIIDDLRTLGTAGNVNWTMAVPVAAPWNVLPNREYWATVFDSIAQIRQNVFAAAFLYPNFLVMDDTMARIMEQVERYTLDPIGDGRGHTSVATTPNLFGVLKNMYNVYVDAFLTANTILVGHRGASLQETGYFDVEINPLWATPIFIDPTHMCPVQGVMSQFARVMVRPELYGTVTGV